MVFGPSSHLAADVTRYGGSMLLQAEGFYTEYAPSKAALVETAFRLYTGNEPSDVDPAHHLPEHGIKGLEPKHEHHKTAVLFEKEDMTAWIVFTLVFFVLVGFDNFVLHRKAEKLSLLKSLLYTTFWIAVAGMFNLYVYYTRGLEDAFSWGTGYLLEWMLSVDNLFVFHRIFTVFKTPDDQKHKPLFYGIIGAIVFRMIFFLIEEILLHHVTWMHIVFGIFLIYTGIKAVSMDDDDESPENGCMYQFLVNRINYVDRYDDSGRFFIPVEVNKDGTLSDEVLSEEQLSALSSRAKQSTAGTEGQAAVQYRPTRLVLVVVCLEVTDLVFAVDSVSAIVAQIPDLFLAYTACVFAMLGLRAMFFAIDELVKMFALLAYGVAFILIFLGCKLILRSWIHIPPSIVCCILVCTLLLSILASLIADKMEKENTPSDTECDPAKEVA